MDSFPKPERATPPTPEVVQAQAEQLAEQVRKQLATFLSRTSAARTAAAKLAQTDKDIHLLCALADELSVTLRVVAPNRVSTALGEVHKPLEPLSQCRTLRSIKCNDDVEVIVMWNEVLVPH